MFNACDANAARAGLQHTFEGWGHTGPRVEKVKLGPIRANQDWLGKPGWGLLGLSRAGCDSLATSHFFDLEVTSDQAQSWTPGSANHGHLRAR